jgi:hypothetical protein
MENISAVANNKPLVTNAEFVRLTIYDSITPVVATSIVPTTAYEIKVSGTTNWTSIGASSNTVGTVFLANSAGTGNGTAYEVEVHTFSSAYQFETINGQEYTPLGGLLAVGQQQRDMRVTSADTSVTISGIPTSTNVATVLDTKIRGSKLEITRGFYGGDGNVANNYILTSYAQRFTGIVTSYSVTEDRQQNDDNFTVGLNASSYKSVLENRVSGRKTNSISWKEYDPNDTSMDQIYSLADQYFDFGGKPLQGATTASQASSQTSVAQTTDSYIQQDA